MKQLIGLLTAFFVLLRLTGAVGWSLVWVLSPLWIGGVLLGIYYGYVTAQMRSAKTS